MCLKVGAPLVAPGSFRLMASKACRKDYFPQQNEQKLSGFDPVMLPSPF